MLCESSLSVIGIIKIVFVIPIDDKRVEIAIIIAVSKCPAIARLAVQDNGIIYNQFEQTAALVNIEHIVLSARFAI